MKTNPRPSDTSFDDVDARIDALAEKLHAILIKINHPIPPELDEMLEEKGTSHDR